MSSPVLSKSTDLTQRAALTRAIESAQNSKAANTRRSYRTSLLQFACFVGLLPPDWRLRSDRIRIEDEAIARSVPASPDGVFRWIGHLDLAGLAPGSIATRLAAIASAHKERRIPIDLTAAQRALAGIRREKASARRMASALRVDDLKRMLPAGDSLRDVRDRALLLLGWAAALRRSELVGLDVAHEVTADAAGWVELGSEGIKVHLLRSKTDALGEGDAVAVPRTGSGFCPANAVERWIAETGLEAGPLFRGINRGGRISEKRLTADGLAHIVKKRAVEADLGERLGSAVLAPSGMPLTCHSLRAGFVTECAARGVGLAVIQQTSRHKDLMVLAGYIREKNKFNIAPHKQLSL